MHLSHDPGFVTATLQKVSAGQIQISTCTPVKFCAGQTVNWLALTPGKVTLVSLRYGSNVAIKLSRFLARKERKTQPLKKVKKRVLNTILEKSTSCNRDAESWHSTTEQIQRKKKKTNLRFTKGRRHLERGWHPCRRVIREIVAFWQVHLQLRYTSATLTFRKVYQGRKWIASLVQRRLHESRDELIPRHWRHFASFKRKHPRFLDELFPQGCLFPVKTVFQEIEIVSLWCEQNTQNPSPPAVIQMGVRSRAHQFSEIPEFGRRWAVQDAVVVVNG